ncbi:MAG: cell division protein SepF [Acidimicrobiia bacterium]|nr:cell division protein SepF [Acidimicrobiia bacterium]
MSGLLKKVALYLGLAPDEEFEHYDEREAEPASGPRPRPANGANGQRTAMSSVGVARPGRPVPADGSPRVATAPAPVRVAPGHADERDREVTAVRPIPDDSDGYDDGSSDLGVRPAASSVSGSVRPVSAGRRSSPAIARPSIVVPESFADAKDVADRFKANQPVVLNLRGVDKELSKRLIDFASGLTYGLSGKIDKVQRGVFLLTPDGVEIPLEEKRRLESISG